MPRIPRGQQGGYVYHVINRGNDRTTVFHKTQDYEAFLSLLIEAKKRHRVKMFGFCLMPNHFHLVLEPAHQTALSQFMQCASMGSDFYKLTIFARLDVELRHGAPSPTIRRGVLYHVIGRTTGCSLSHLTLPMKCLLPKASGLR